MSEWLDRLFNEPIRDNPWALGLMIALALAYVGPLLVMMGRDMFRRRKQETTVEPNDPNPIQPMPSSLAGPDGSFITDAAIRDHESAERVIAASRADGDDQSWRVITDGPIDRSGQPTGERGDDGMSDESQRLAELMKTDPKLSVDPLGAPMPGMQGDGSSTETWPVAGTGARQVSMEFVMPEPARNILAGAELQMPAHTPRPVVSAVRETCEHCGGMGSMPSINDLLRESIGLVGDTGGEIVHEFYRRLLSAAPDLASLFPPDLLTTDETKGQRDKLLKALVALSDLYDPADGEKMAKLDTALGAFGRSHSSFVRLDGTVKGATWEEYGAVKATLFGTLTDFAGKAWQPVYTEAWSQAYDYAAAVMLAEQYRSGFSAPRFPRA